MAKNNSKYRYSAWRVAYFYCFQSHWELSTAFLVAVTYSFLYHMWFLKIPGLYSWSYDFGVWFAVIVEGFITGALFYYVTDLIPSKQKRIDTRVVLQNKISDIYLRVRILFVEFGYPIETGFHRPQTAEELKDKLKSIPNKTEVISGVIAKIIYPTLAHFTFEKLEEIRKQIFEVYIFQDILDSEVILQLSIADSNIIRLIQLKADAMLFENLDSFYYSLFEIYKCSEKALHLYEENNDIAIAIGMERSRRETLKALRY